MRCASDGKAAGVIDRASLIAAVGRLRDSKVLCVGDFMLDRFVYGQVERISPEAPIPVMRETRTLSMPGGAGNVANNVVALGAACHLVGVIGEDADGDVLKTMLERLGGPAAHILAVTGRPTTVKTRFVAGGQQMLRVDQEIRDDLASAMQDTLLASIETLLPDSDAVVMSDYGKGVLTEHVTQTVIGLASKRGVPVIVDPKGSDYGRYAGADAVTPNRAELAAATGSSVVGDDAVAEAARDLTERHKIGMALVTRSDEGMTLQGGGDALHLRAEAREVYDVSGAGDTVAATFAAALGVGESPHAAASLANVAAGIVVGKMGTATVDATDLVASLQATPALSTEAKILNSEVAKSQVDEWRRAGLTIGFTNGCFDLLHPGHLSLMHQAKSQCDRLIVGLNSDASVRRLKGEGRPVQNEIARAQVLGSLEAVDMVVVFDADTPLALIETLRPDVLVKGADYRIDQVVGADVVTRYGGRVVLANLQPGFSTTNTISRIAG